MPAATFLMYHQLGAASVTEPRYVVSEAGFRAQLGRLKSAGYEVTSVGHALAQPIRQRPRVVVTFDDGAESDRTIAAPLLLEHGFSATFYVVPGLLGRRGYMTEVQLRELAGLGFEIGSHSLTHRYLSDLAAEALDEEVLGSRHRLEDILGRPVRHFACPGGRVSRAVVEAVQAAGYESLSTSRLGRNHAGTDRFNLSRFVVFRHTSLAQLEHACRGEGLLMRRLTDALLAVAKNALGNGAYDRLRRLALGGSPGTPAVR
jgi:peptidoglycan/xylan/chitin deacetylase (PgdA/CDA1 family)